MSSKRDKEAGILLEKKNVCTTKTKNYGEKNQLRNKTNGIIYISYKLDKQLLINNRNIILFGEEFIKNNKNKCNIIIGEKEYETVSEISVEKFKKFTFNEEVEILKVKLEGNEIDNMSKMFFDCKNLIEIDLSSFNTKNVTNMTWMFAGCKKINKIDLSMFNTQKVTNMAYMFATCENLIEINLSSFNTQNVTNMSSMFVRCKNLIKVDLSSFNTQNVTNMDGMFVSCRNLIKVDLSSFNTQNISEVSWMFGRCESLVKINRKNFYRVKNDLELIESKLSIIEI